MPTAANFETEAALIAKAATVEFAILESKISPTADGEDTIVDIVVQLGDPADEMIVSPDHEWGGLPFLYALLLLSFSDARPRGISGEWFEDDDQFSVGDLLECFQFERGCLMASVDYLRGRCVKTDITVDKTGKLTLATRNRGEAALRWLRMLRGERTLQVVDP